MLQIAEIGHRVDKPVYDKTVAGLREALIDAQYDLSRSQSFSTVVLLSGLNAAGKSETVHQLLAWLDPRFVETYAIGTEETDDQRLRPFMWRFWQMLPPKGRIAIFFEHWYTLPGLRRATREISDAEFDKHLAEINRFERMLTDEGVLLLKFYLHISKKEQRKRLKRLAADPQEAWRVSPLDELAAKHTRRIGATIEKTFRLTNHGHAPWIVVEATDRRYRELVVAQTIHQALRNRLAAAKAMPAGTRRAPDIHIPNPDNKSVLASLDYRKAVTKRAYQRELPVLQSRLGQLMKSKRMKARSLILAFEGTDAAGKGGAIRRVAEAMDPRYYRIVPVAKPTDEEAGRPYLWRFWRHVPRQGHATMFDRTWYGRVLVERVEGFCLPSDSRRAYGEINDFESDLTREGAIVVKFWLAITKQEQLRRFKDRQRQPFKRFKITKEDWRNRERWDDYERAVSDMVALTSTDVAPWTLVEAEDKNYARLKVVRTICEQIEAAI